jgi:predicted ArsR family transcriptional regulator
LPRHPVVSVAFAIKQLGVSKPTAGRAVEALEKAAVLVETTGKKRGRSWVYQLSRQAARGNGAGDAEAAMNGRRR